MNDDRKQKDILTLGGTNDYDDQYTAHKNDKKRHKNSTKYRTVYTVYGSEHYSC
jgi:hypothetical protein